MEEFAAHGSLISELFHHCTRRMDSGRMPGGDPFDPEASEERVRFAQQMADPLAAQMEGSKGRKEAHGPQIKLCSLCGPAKNEG